MADHQYEWVEKLSAVEAKKRAIAQAAKEGCTLGLTERGMKAIGVNKAPTDYLATLIRRAGPELRATLTAKHFADKAAHKPGRRVEIIDGQRVQIGPEGQRYVLETGDHHLGPPEDEPPETTCPAPTDGEILRFQRLSVPFTMVPNIVFSLAKSHKLDPSTQALLWQLLRHSYGFHQDSTGVCVQTLADDANICKRTATTALGVLEEKRLIRRTRRSGPRGERLPDLITLTLPGVNLGSHAV